MAGKQLNVKIIPQGAKKRRAANYHAVILTHREKVIYKNQPFRISVMKSFD